MDNVVIGQYIPGDSIIHKLDPRMKIILLVLMIVITFMAPSLIYVSLVLLFVICIILLSKTPLRKVIKGLKSLIFLLCFTIIIQLGYETSGELLFKYQMNMTLYNLVISVGLLVLYFLTKSFIKFKFTYFLLLVALSLYLQYSFNEGLLLFSYNLRVYESGVNMAGYVFIRIVSVVLLSSLLTFTTSPNDLNNGIESVLSPLKIIKVPVGEIAMMLSLVLRFVPTLLQETNKIMKAQASRGVDFLESSFSKKIQQIVSLLVPMFVISLKRAEELADAMESRGYVIGEKRTKLDEMKIKAKDIMALLVISLLMAVIIYAKWFS